MERIIQHQQKNIYMTGINFKQKGITLVELVVVLAVFSVIIGVTAGIFNSFISQQRRILAEQELLSQTSYAVERITRQLRDSSEDVSGACLGGSFIGYYYSLSNFDSINNFYQGVRVLTKDGDCYNFFLDTDGILKEVKNGSNPEAILSDKFNVSHVRFVVNGDKTLNGTSSSNLVQPRISVSIKLQFEVNGVQEEKIIQTTISQSQLNVSDL